MKLRGPILEAIYKERRSASFVERVVYKDCRPGVPHWVKLPKQENGFATSYQFVRWKDSDRAVGRWS